MAADRQACRASISATLQDSVVAIAPQVEEDRFVRTVRSEAIPRPQRRPAVKSDKLRIGVIGVGVAFQHLHLPNIVRYADALDLVAVAATSDASASAAAELVVGEGIPRPSTYSDAHELLAESFDAILLDVPISSTYALGLDVIKAGVHLICEKPLGESAAEGAKLAKAAEAAGVTLAVCENFRYQPRFAEIAQLVTDGLIGEPRAYFLDDLHYTGPDGLYSVTPWRQGGDHRGGYLLDGGSHIVAGLREMVGETPASVYALPTSFHPGHLGSPWDTALVNLRFDSGLVGHLALGYGSPDREARHPKILGTTGTLAIMEDSIAVWRPDGTKDAVIPLADLSDGTAREWDDFVAALCGGSPLTFSAWEGVADLAVLDAVLDSSENGEVVAVKTYG